MWKQTFLPLIAAFFALSSLAGCGGDGSVETGDLQIAYRIGSGSSTCAQVGIDFVRVRLMTSGGTQVLEETVACAPADQNVMLKDVEEGTYTVKVDGLAGGNNVIYTGTTGSVKVLGKQTNGPVTVVMTQVLPSLRLWIDFAEAGNCSKFAVKTIRIVLYKDGASVVYDEDFDCAERLADALLIENLSDTATYDLRVRAANSNGEYTFSYDEDGISVGAGEPTERTVELVACTGICAQP